MCVGKGRKGMGREGKGRKGKEREGKEREGKGPGSIVSRKVPVRSKMEKKGGPRDLKETRTALSLTLGKL